LGKLLSHSQSVSLSIKWVQFMLKNHISEVQGAHKYKKIWVIRELSHEALVVIFVPSVISLRAHFSRL
jgi:hypothetical protein